MASAALQEKLLQSRFPRKILRHFPTPIIKISGQDQAFVARDVFVCVDAELSSLKLPLRTAQAKVCADDGEKTLILFNPESRMEK